MKTKKRIKHLEQDVDFLFDDLKRQRKGEKLQSKWIKAIDEYAHNRMDLVELKHLSGIK